MISEQYRILLAKHLAAENAHLLDDTLLTLSQDCIFDDKDLNKIFYGRDGASRYYQQWWQAFNITVSNY